MVEKIMEDMKEAMRSHNELRLSVLRMVSAAIKNKQIEKRGKGQGDTLTDDETVAVLRSEAKKRRDAAEEYQKGGREESALQEQQELAIIEEYLPAELSDIEIEKLLQPLVKGATLSDFGRVMSLAMKAIGNRASGDRVSTIVKKLLT